MFKCIVLGEFFVKRFVFYYEIDIYFYKIFVSMYLKILRVFRLEGKVIINVIFVKDWIRVLNLGFWGGGRGICLYIYRVSSCLSGVIGGGDERVLGLKIFLLVVFYCSKFLYRFFCGVYTEIFVKR